MASPLTTVRLDTRTIRAIALPIGLIGLVLVIVVPLPTAVMDFLIAINLTIAAVVLLTTIYMEKPLEFSVFPALLLVTTLFRLALNIATTRLILSTDATTPEEARDAAGKIIGAFGEFVAGDSPIVGTVIFTIIVVVQFVVITKGAGRISEVAARFTLDAMPGKQMAIDADLTSGLIDEAEARKRREAITREADFYGAMDGASKFVRGDAMAGILITFINVIGGFAVGAIYKDWGIRESLGVFTLLTIGDGLVSQIPSFITAIASGLIVARSSSDDDLGQDITGQLGREPRALFMTSGFLALMSVTGLPLLPMLICSGATAAIGWAVQRSLRREKDLAETGKAASVPAPSDAADGPSVDELLKVDLLELEVGYALVRIVKPNDNGGLLKRISLIRKQLAAEHGFVLPPVRIRDNQHMDQYAYRIKIRGATVAEGSVYPELWLAMDSGMASGPIEGAPTKEPAYGLDAWWIEDHYRMRAESSGYTVVDASSVLMTHFTETVKNYADEMLTRQELYNLLAGLQERAPKLKEEAIPDRIKPAELQKVLQALLRERVPIRDLETIVETLSDWTAHTRDIDILIEYVRNALRRSIAAQYAAREADGRLKVHCLTVDPAVEEIIASYVDRGPAGTVVAVPPQETAQLVQAVSTALTPLLSAGHGPVLLASPQVRGPIRKILEPHAANVAVLGYNEIPAGFEIESHGLVQFARPGGGERTSKARPAEPVGARRG